MTVARILGPIGPGASRRTEGSGRLTQPISRDRLSHMENPTGATIDEAAAALSVSRATIYRMIDDSRLTRIYAFERLPLITWDSITAVLRDRRTA